MAADPSSLETTIERLHRAWGLALATPVIVKRGGDETDTKTELEAWPR